MTTKESMKSKKQRKQPRKNGPSKAWAWGIIILGSGVALYLWLGFGQSSQSTVSHNDPAVIAQGERLFAKNCAVCHGQRAVGENPSIPMGGTKKSGGYLAPALNGTGHAWHHPPDALFKIVRDGSAVENSAMVRWSDRLTDTDIHAVIAYFQSLWPTKIKGGYKSRFGG